MVGRQQQILREMEEKKKELDRVRLRLHSAKRSKRKNLRRQSDELRRGMTENLYDLLDLQRRDRSA